MKKVAGQVLVMAAGSIASVAAVYFLFKKLADGVTDSEAYKLSEKAEDVVSYYPAMLWHLLVAGPSAGFNDAKFYLNSKYVTADYRIDPVWRRSMEAANSGIPALFNQLLDDSGRIKTQYRKLINQAVHAGVL